MGAMAFLPTITLITYDAVGNTISIKAEYVGDLDSFNNVMFVDITEENVILESLQVQQGNLYAYVKNYPNQINMLVDDNGHCILFSSTGDENKYSVDVNGHLLYQID